MSAEWEGHREAFKTVPGDFDLNVLPTVCISSNVQNHLRCAYVVFI